MNKIVSLILIVFCLFLFSELKASHAMGADLTYECLGGDQYRITLAFTEIVVVFQHRLM